MRLTERNMAPPKNSLKKRVKLAKFSVKTCPAPKSKYFKPNIYERETNSFYYPGRIITNLPFLLRFYQVTERFKEI